ncbi:MAG: thiamine phosphate synthase [Coxiellaceae bacterium]|nr:thiamine phosphate synthase [Coxiellaceae bacterium]
MTTKINWQQALKCCLVIGPSSCNKTSWIDIIQSAIRGGITSVQLREKQATEKHILEIAQQLLRVLPSHIPLIINDHVMLAKQLNCAVHIGQSDHTYTCARDIMGKDACIGLSIENIEQAERYKKCGANYFGVGPVFETTSKSDAAKPLGIVKAAHIIERLAPSPCVLIGGITSTNVAQLPKNKAGIAVISAITQAQSPQFAAQQLLQELQ